MRRRQTPSRRPIAPRSLPVLCTALSSLVAASHLYVWRQIPGFSHEFDPLLRPAAGLRSRCNACAGAGPPRAVLGRRTAAVLRADRAARAAGGGQRLCRQDRAEPQSAAGRSDLPPLLRRARPAARADAALARIGRDGRCRPGSSSPTTTSSRAPIRSRFRSPTSASSRPRSCSRTAAPIWPCCASRTARRNSRRSTLPIPMNCWSATSCSRSAIPSASARP